MQQTQGTARQQENTRNPRPAPVLGARQQPGRDGPMGYGPHAPSGDQDPESHIFRGED
ncbi:hypothetical protein SALCHL_001239 [Streptomyces albus subsp. chlorinus]|uniref:hypothetical protein n=1 Tax=Streptomyces albus TaxID=1888 RepID=UPI001570C2D3|nr:hypothetical protein [Streptomyces albus]